MRFELVLSLFVLIVAVSGKNIESSKKSDEKDDARFFTALLTTLTFYTSTTTSTSTFVTTTTCTTSTASLSTCTAGRRRRGLYFADEQQALFDKTIDDDIEAGILSKNINKRSNDPVDEVKPSKSDSKLVPVEIQTGFNVPEQLKDNRFMLAFAVSTVTSVTVSTTTASLTAVCRSTTNFAVCSSGK